MRKAYETKMLLEDTTRKHLETFREPTSKKIALLKHHIEVCFHTTAPDRREQQAQVGSKTFINPQNI